MTDVMIEATGLSKSYGPFAALKGVSFEVGRGEVLGFLGPNGAGKTTTMKILTCFMAPSEGSARVNGADIHDDPLEVRRSIGYLPESNPLYTEMLVLEYLEFVAKMRGLKGRDASKHIKAAVEQTSLGDVISKEIRQLSKGYRQRVGLAQALVHEPPILILDEPLSGLDPNQASEIRDVIREIGKERTVILSTHNLSEVRSTCTRVLIVAGGRIVADATADELTSRAGKATVIATVLASESDEGSRVKKIFAELSGADDVRIHSGEAAGELIVDITPSTAGDIRAEVFAAAVKNDLVLVGLERRGKDLEGVFRELTTDAADGGSQ